MRFWMRTMILGFNFVESNPNGKGLIYQYSINLKEPLKRLNASTFQEAKKQVEKFIENANNR